MNSANDNALGERECNEEPYSMIFRTLTVLLLTAAILIGLGLVIVGALTGETIRANLAFALIVDCVLVVFAVLFSYGASLRVQQVARNAWLIVAVLCIVYAEYILNLDYPDVGKDADTILVIAMLGLSFPAGFVIYGFIVAYSILLLEVSGIVWNVDVWNIIVIWALFTVAGYVQFFRLLPYLIRSRFTSNSSSNHE